VHVFKPVRNTILCHDQMRSGLEKVNDTEIIGSKHWTFYHNILCIYNPQQQCPGKTSITRNGLANLFKST